MQTSQAHLNLDGTQANNQFYRLRFYMTGRAAGLLTSASPQTGNTLDSGIARAMAALGKRNFSAPL